MKLSKILHIVTIVSGLFGGFALISVSYATKYGFAFGLSEAHLFNDAIVWILFAILFQLGAIHHMMLEKNKEKI